MAKTEEVTPYAIRSQTGETFYVDTLREALEEFLGPEGYRLTLTSPGQELAIRRSGEWVPRFEHERECNCSLTARDTRGTPREYDDG